MLVLGAGPGGYSAAFRAADLGMKTVIVERYATLGGVCLNVGCIPSKALLHVAAVMEEAAHANELGVSFAAPVVDLDKLRAHKEKVVGKLTGGLSGMAKARKVETVRGYGHFLDAHHLEVEETTGTSQEKTGAKKVVRFEKCIIAAGSAAFHLPFIPRDPRIVDSTGALELRFVPQAHAGDRRRHHRPGDGDGVLDAGRQGRRGRNARRPDAGPGPRPGQGLGKAERQALRQAHAQDQNRWSRPKRTASGSSSKASRRRPRSQRYDMILQSAGRSPNGRKIGADKAGVVVNERGFIPVDSQMRTNVPHIFAIGDIVGQPMLAHKAVHEAHVAAEAAAGRRAISTPR
jgi:dihydrolipoamide dehydrogenase